MKYSAITYLALNDQGCEVERPAQIIDDLPTPEMRLTACKEATRGLSKLIGFPAYSPIRFGADAYLAFGMTRAAAKTHEHAAVLLKRGCDIPLRYCQ